VVAVVLGLVLLAGSWLDMRNRMNDLQHQLVRELAEAGGYSKESRDIAQQTRQNLHDLEYKVGSLESRLSETQSQRMALEALYAELSRNRDERVLAEVEQMLLIASQQLQLAGNLKAAIVALESADARLQRADSAQFTNLRRAIARDLERLRSVPFVDVIGMSVRLDATAHQTDDMALAMYQRPGAEKSQPVATESNLVVRVAAEMWQEVRGLVQVQRVNSADVPVVSPSQQFFLRENLRLRLLSARIALIAREEAAFKADIRSSQEWLQRYFDPHDRQVASALNLLKQLSSMQVSIDLPNQLESLSAARSQKLVRERVR
jgi:uroporphyrin-III C-methyltransferase